MPAGIDTAVNPAAICEHSSPSELRRSAFMKPPSETADPTQARKLKPMTILEY